METNINDSISTYLAKYVLTFLNKNNEDEIIDIKENIKKYFCITPIDQEKKHQLLKFLIDTFFVSFKKTLNIEEIITLFKNELQYFELEDYLGEKTYWDLILNQDLLRLNKEHTKEEKIPFLKTFVNQLKNECKNYFLCYACYRIILDCIVFNNLILVDKDFTQDLIILNNNIPEDCDQLEIKNYYKNLQVILGA